MFEYNVFKNAYKKEKTSKKFFISPHVGFFSFLFFSQMCETVNLKKKIWLIIVFFKSIKLNEANMRQNNLFFSFYISYHEVTLATWSSLTLGLSIAPGWSSRLYLVFAQKWCMSLLVGQHWHIHMQVSIKEHHLWVHLCFSSSGPHILFIYLKGLWDER